MRISVVIPARNSAETIGLCIEALLAQSTARGEYEVIVVDDGSTDGTAAIAEGEGTRVLSQPHHGPAAARNLGLREARGEIVLFTDADCIPTSTWIEEMTKPFADPDVVGVKGAYSPQLLSQPLLSSTPSGHRG